MMGLSLYCVNASLSQPRIAVQPNISFSWFEQRQWHQHYDNISLQVALPIVKYPGEDDPVPLRISGVWINRINFNLWRHRNDAFISTYPNVVHGYIDESDSRNIPRYTFMGDNWITDASAKLAKQLIIKALTEWASLEASKSPVSQQKLKTGLAFMLVEPTAKTPKPEAEIEFYWRPLGMNLAADMNRIILGDGVVTKTQLTFNASNNWWFGTTNTTPRNAMHFYSSALHETGHVVGLWETSNISSVMIHDRTPGPNGPAFDAIDEISKRVVYALYSIPVAGAVHPTLTFAAKD